MSEWMNEWMNEWVIAGTRICKLVTRSLVVDGHRVEANPNSRVRRSIVPEKRTLAEVRCDQILMRTCIVRCSDSEFSLWQFFSARLEVLPNLRHKESFRWVRWLTSGLDWREDEHFLLDSARSRGIYNFQLAGKWSESEKISCHAILKNLYEPKMDVILTISFKVTRKSR